MKTKEEVIERLRLGIENSQSNIKTYISRIAQIEDSVELPFEEFQSEFYLAIQGKSKLITITLKHQEYEHILGGDGRSAAWSEMREGTVAHVESMVFLVSDTYQSDITKDYKKYIEKILHAHNVSNVTFERNI